MPSLVTPNTGIELAYETHGDPADETMLLVMGLGVQLTHWPDELIEALVARGFHVVRFDNRDIGLSQKMGDAAPPNLRWQVLRKVIGWPVTVPYTLADMADDAVGLLEGLGIAKAHVVGVSMGGMIGQLMAVHHRERLLSLTSVMSTTGNPRLPRAERAAMRALTSRPPSLEEQALVDHGVMILDAIGSPGFPAELEDKRRRVGTSVQRSIYPKGLPRQLAAIIDDGDRRARLASVTTPTLVLHGEADPLIKVAAAHDTAKAIAGSKLVTIPGWGHDLPTELTGRLADEIAGHAREAVGETSRELA
ncbi:MAG: alpha/beta hydrolase [Erythrobacter sp.]|jgi:pimeloyl-ACP methyl ester carboxylesterase|nr:alpha/beta hydrolase [Erythrobacter sp.]